MVVTKSRISSALVVLVLCVVCEARAESTELVFNPVPAIEKIPSNPSAVWLSQVFQYPAKYGLGEWEPVDARLSDSSGLISYSINFASSYPIDKHRLFTSMPRLNVKWINPRVNQSLSLNLWKQDVDGVLKKEAPWITPGNLTWTLVNFVYECAVPGRIYRIDLTTIDARSRKRLEHRTDNKILEMDYTNSWPRVCGHN